METIPKLFEDRTHNLEFYAQKRVYAQLKLLNKLPIVQNISGEFTNYVSSDADDVIGDVVSAGDGLSEIFKGLGVDYVIEGGQTMNPSTEDIVSAVEKINAKTVFVLPNNKNIIMAANQAEYLVEDKKVVVIPTKTIPQGIAALINFAPDQDADTNKESMIGELEFVKTGQVTYAVRDTMIDDKEIREGDFMGIGDSGLLSVNADINKATFEMIDAMVDDSVELLSIYYGADVTEEDANVISDYVSEKYPHCDVEVECGGQPVYYYIVSAE